MMKYVLAIVCLSILVCHALPHNERYPRASECSENTDCPTHNYCHYSYWLGQRCLTNMKIRSHYRTAYCRVIKSDGESFPDHERCAEYEAERYQIPIETTTMRCFDELDYMCAPSYFMPCTQNYDYDGEPIEGTEESCPVNFTCQREEFKNTGAKVCVPNEPTPTENQDESGCQTSFDCGYSLLSNSWSKCRGIRARVGGHCSRVVE